MCNLKKIVRLRDEIFIYSWTSNTLRQMHLTCSSLAYIIKKKYVNIA